MEDKRYPESTDEDSIPDLTFGEPSSNSTTYSEQLRKERRLGYYIPNSVNLSTTSKASDCFVKREFSNKLQQFIISYSYVLVTSTVLSGEI